MIFLASFVVIVGLATLSGKLSAVIAAQIPETPEATVRNAWSRAQQSGQYQFDTQIRQTVYPALSLGNVGESPRETYVTMRGETNLQTQLMQMSLRPEQGATAPEREQVDFKVQGD